LAVVAGIIVVLVFVFGEDFSIILNSRRAVFYISHHLLLKKIVIACVHNIDQSLPIIKINIYTILY